MSTTTKEMTAWEPHPYQEWGVEKMVANGAAGLLFDPGLGKTSCALAAFMILKKMGYVNRALVIAPLRVARRTWPKEIDKWSNFQHLVYDVMHGSTKQWTVDNVEGTDIVLMNPEGLQWLVGKSAKEFKADKLQKLGCDVLIVDESTKFKHSNTVRFKLLRKMLPYFKRRYILTGTFSPNGLMDVFGQIFILDGGASLGQYITHFRKQFFDQPDPIYEPYRYEPKPNAMEDIADRIAPLVMRLKAEDYIDMPELQNIILPSQLPEKAKEIYDNVENDFIHEFEDGNAIIAANSAVSGNKLRQVCNGAIYTEYGDVIEIHNGKLEVLEDLIEELQGQPVFILYEFIHDRDRILQKFPWMPYIGSGVSETRESELLDKWDRGELPALLAHPQSVGHGLNMQEGTCYRVCWFGITWNFETYDQALRRIWRQGQKSATVLNYLIVAEGTIDEDVVEVLKDKDATQEKLNQMITARNKNHL